MSHKWLLLMCAGCLAAGILAGQFVEVDETKLKPKFSKMDVIEAASKEFEFRPDLAATCIRVVFVLAARRAGFAADTIDESCAVVEGLTDVAGVMNFLMNRFNGSMEDISSLAAIAGIKYLKGPYKGILDQWQWGRNDTDAAPPRNVPKNAAVKTFSIPTILKALGDLTDEECVALLACHSVGEFHETVSGVDGATHTGKRYTLSNEYYKFILDHEKSFKPLEVLPTEDNKHIKTLPTTLVHTKVAVGGTRKKRECVFNRGELDILLKNKAWRSIVVRFASDEGEWQRAFESGFTKLIDSHFKRLRVYSEPDET
ncbi:hypothetical protein STCU_03851 [Strigomonas culicis]|nr:hypothetical protein STCU_03851 [Strigomonas culicis]|eukprot:EPY30852.1 hypothetical protein STCU_03851 [Strigomonas culicis]